MKCPQRTIAALLLAACACAPLAPPGGAPSPAPHPAESTCPAAGPTSPSPQASPTAEPYAPYTVAHLRERAYGGDLAFTERLGGNSAFTRWLFRYDSDGLAIHGFANLPHGDGPFPVVIALHGYVEPEEYQTLDYTTHNADALASAGYLVLHPNLRGYPPSDTGENLFRVGMAVDTLNLIAIVRAQGGGQGPLGAADPGRIGLWGHSMGGGVATRVLTVDPQVRAAVLYAPMSGDERTNYEAIWRWLEGRMGAQELAVPLEALPGISPRYFYADVRAAVSLHHGLQDRLVPPAWSMSTCEQLGDLGVVVECHYYEDMPHTFHGPEEKVFMRYAQRFFDTHLAAP